jgi:hypothetical protein
MHVQRITPCLWFDFQAEEAARFYCDVFSNSRILRISRYGDAGREIHGQPSGSVMTVMFELDGQTFTALNGGPVFNSMKRSRCRSIATPRRNWIITGTGFPLAATNRRSYAAGSRTGTACRGRSSPPCWWT